MIFFNKKAKCPIAGRMKCEECRFYVTRIITKDLGGEAEETKCIEEWKMLETEQMHHRIFALQAEMGELKQVGFYSIVYQLTNDEEAKRILKKLFNEGSFNVSGTIDGFIDREKREVAKV